MNDIDALTDNCAKNKLKTKTFAEPLIRYGAVGNQSVILTSVDV